MNTDEMEFPYYNVMSDSQMDMQWVDQLSPKYIQPPFFKRTTRSGQSR